MLTETKYQTVPQKLKSKLTEVEFCNIIKQKEKGKRGERRGGRRDALLITEPSAEFWTAANSTGSWDRGWGRERERGGLLFIVIERGWGGDQKGRNRVEEEMGSPERECGREK